MLHNYDIRISMYLKDTDKTLTTITRKWCSLKHAKHFAATKVLDLVADARKHNMQTFLTNVTISKTQKVKTFVTKGDNRFEDVPHSWLGYYDENGQLEIATDDLD